MIWCLFCGSESFDLAPCTECGQVTHTDCPYSLFKDTMDGPVTYCGRCARRQPNYVPPRLYDDEDGL